MECHENGGRHGRGGGCDRHDCLRKPVQGKSFTLDAVLPDQEAKAENTSEPTELKLRDFMVRVDLKALNSDPDLSVPEDVKAAAVEGSTDNAMDMLSDLSDMFS